MKVLLASVFIVLMLINVGILLWIALENFTNQSIATRLLAIVGESLFICMAIVQTQCRLRTTMEEYFVWFASFSTFSFFIFVGVELYLAIREKFEIDLFALPEPYESSVITLYIYLYYLFNFCYSGVCVLLMILLVVYRILKCCFVSKREKIMEQIQNRWEWASDTSEPCSICFSEYTRRDKIYRLECKHYFHCDCLKQWLERHLSCPLCRSTKF